MKENISEEKVEIFNDGLINSDKVVKNISNIAKNISKLENENFEDIVNKESQVSKFKLCENTLPEKTGLWVKVKNVLFYEIKLELTPHQQKIEKEINDFLHQEVDFKAIWKKIDNFLFQEITFKKKKIE